MLNISVSRRAVAWSDLVLEAAGSSVPIGSSSEQETSVSVSRTSKLYLRSHFKLIRVFMVSTFLGEIFLHGKYTIKKGLFNAENIYARCGNVI